MGCKNEKRISEGKVVVDVLKIARKLPCLLDIPYEAEKLHTALNDAELAMRVGVEIGVI